MKGIFVDFETGGLDTHVCAITHMAAIPFEIEGETVTLDNGRALDLAICPYSMLPDHLSAEALRIQGHTLETLNQRPDQVGEWQAIGALYELLAQVRTDLWSWNAPFDSSCANSMARRQGYKAPPAAHPRAWRCARNLALVSLSVGVITESGLASGALKQWSRVIGGREQPEPHTAAGDCCVSVATLAAILKRWRAQT